MVANAMAVQESGKAFNSGDGVTPISGVRRDTPALGDPAADANGKKTPPAIDPDGRLYIIDGRPILTGAPTTAIHGSVQSLGTRFGPMITVQLEITATKHATVELYGRLTAAAAWVLFETVTLDDDQFLKTYDGALHIAWKVTAIDAATTVKAWAA